MRKNKQTHFKEGYKILLLDDEAGIIDSLSVVLKRGGYHTAGCTDPYEAIRLLQEEHYDMLILDYLMERMNGNKVVEKIRTFNLDIYILLLTGQKDLAPPIETVKELDIQGYCEKSDRFDQLLMMVEAGIKSISQMRKIRDMKNGLDKMLQSVPKIYQLQSVEKMAEDIMNEIVAMVPIKDAFILIDGEEHIEGNVTGIFKGIGKYLLEESLATSLDMDLVHAIGLAGSTNQVIKMENGAILPLKNQMLNAIGVIYIEGNVQEMIEILEIYSNQASASLNNAFLHLLVNKKNAELNNAYKDVKELYSLLEKSYRDEIGKNEVLGKIVENKTADIKNLLDNAGQGFLSFTEDLLVEKEYSLECEKIFECDIQNKFFPELVYAEDIEQVNFLKTILRDILYERNALKREAYLALLPQEIELNGKFVNLEYKIIKSGQREQLEKFMVILTNITEKRLLQDQMEQERNILNMVVKIVANQDDFFSLVHQYQEFYRKNLDDILNTKKPMQEICYSIFRNIHTFKGSFSQLSMVNVARRLHEFESAISDIVEKIDSMTQADLKLLIEANDMYLWLEQDLDVLKEVLGESFFNRENTMIVDKSKFKEIERKMEKANSVGEYRFLIKDLKVLRYKPFRELLRSYPDYVLKLGEQLDKPINPMVIESDEIVIDPEDYNCFTKSLVNVFRNILDHGLESMEERIAKGKEDYGNVRCTIKKEKSNIIVCISDDGRGIDPEEIKRKALRKSILDEEQVKKLTEEDIIELIFENEFSTREDISELSGRGFGLSSVKNEVLKLGGWVKVETKVGEGTAFIFNIPVREKDPSLSLSLNQVMGSIAETARKLMEAHYGETMNSQPTEIERTCRMTLREFTSFINTAGILKGKFIVGFDRNLIEKIAFEFGEENLSEEEWNTYLEEILAEFSNIIVGNSIRLLPELENLIDIEAPLNFLSKDTAIECLNSQIYTSSLHFISGSISLGFIAASSLHEAPG
ncbi:MAG: DUF3369 domain-containing protein [Clostridia bacterium]|nr:DUF3369 domain-containing protein [Clostridia bacterium]